MKHTETHPLLPETTTTSSQESQPMPSLPINSAGGLSPAVQKHIGNLLRVSYQDLLTEPVPDKFASLLDQLEKAEKKSGGGE